MSKEKILFIIRAKKGHNAVCRCINSVRRQESDGYELSVCVYNKKELEQLQNEYPGINFSFVKNDNAFIKSVNSLVKQSDAEYCVMLDGDSIVSPYMVKALLNCNEDTIIFNMAKLNDNNRFKVYYADKTLENEASYMKRIQSVWAVAVKIEMMKEKDIALKGMDYPSQALYLLLSMAYAQKVRFIQDCLVYKEKVIGDVEITADFFDKNKKEIIKAIKSFAQSGRSNARAQVIRVFMMNKIEESFNLPFAKRMREILSLVKVIWF